MAIAPYTDIQIHPQAGSFSVLMYTKKPTKIHKLETLARIERVFREKLVCATESYALLSEKELSSCLKNIASQILQSRQEKVETLCEVLCWPPGPSVTRKIKAMEDTVQRIQHLICPPRLFAKLPTDLVGHISRFLTVREIAALSLINKDAAAQAKRAKIRRAKEFGWEGDDPAKVDEYLQSLLPFLTLAEKYAVRKGSPWAFDVERTLRVLEKEKPEIPPEPHETLGLQKFERKRHRELWKMGLLFASQSPNYNQKTFLYNASFGCFEEMVALALLRGAHVNSQDTRGISPLGMALSEIQDKPKKDVEKTVERLLDAGANPSISVATGNFPLHLAAEAGYANIVKLLIQKRADVNRPGAGRITPLCWALILKEGRVEEEIETTAAVLLKAGADLTIPTQKGNLPIHLAAQSGYAKIITLLIAHQADVNSQGLYGLTPLSWALLARRGRSEREIEKTVENLLDDGADLSIPEENGNLPLHFAAQAGYATMVSLLIQRGALVNGKGYKGLTPLLWALQGDLAPPFEREVEKTVETLLIAGADPNLAGEDGNSLLHWAASKGAKGVISLLLLYGADKTLQNNQGKIPRDLTKNVECRSLLNPLP